MRRSSARAHTSGTVRRGAALAAGLALAVTGAAGAVAGASTTQRPVAIAIAARHQVVRANGTDTSRIGVRLFHGRAARHAAVTLSTSANPSGACGTLGATTGETGRFGFFGTTYTASSTVGFCTVTATSGTATASVTIDQVDPTLAAAQTRYTTTATATPTKLTANGTSTSTVTITVEDGTTPVAGDTVLLNARSLRSGVCGTVSLAAPTTDASGQVTATYTSSTFDGICVLRAWEAATASHSKAIVILQSGGTRHHHAR